MKMNFKIVFISVLSVMLFGCNSKITDINSIKEIKIGNEAKYIFNESYNGQTKIKLLNEDGILNQEFDIKDEEFNIARDSRYVYFFSKNNKKNYRMDINNKKIEEINLPNLNNNMFKFINNSNGELYLTSNRLIYDISNNKKINVDEEVVMDVKKIQDKYYILSSTSGSKGESNKNKVFITEYNSVDGSNNKINISDMKEFDNIQQYSSSLLVLNNEIHIIGIDGQIMLFKNGKLTQSGKIEGFKNSISTKIESNGKIAVISQKFFWDNGYGSNYIIDDKYNIKEISDGKITKYETLSINIINNEVTIYGINSMDEKQEPSPLIIKIDLDTKKVSEVDLLQSNGNLFKDVEEGICQFILLK